jgi:hypothetical protein
MKLLLFLSLLLPLIGLSQSLEFYGIQIILNQKSDMARDMIESVGGFKLKSTSKDNLDINNKATYEYEKNETNEYVIFRETIFGNNSIHYMFYNNAHFVFIRSQIANIYKIKKTDNKGTIIQEEYESKEFNIMLLKGPLHNYSVSILKKRQ